MDTATLVARLKSQLTGLKHIGASVDLDAAIAGKPVTPSAFVLPLAESATDEDMLSETAESVVQSFGVVHVVSNRRDTKGSAALDELTPLRSNLRTALVGWVPLAATGEPMHFYAGRLLRMDGDGCLWWIDEFRLKTYWSN